jgi:hypothetical protein
MQQVYLTFRQVSSAPHKETVHVKEQDRKLGFIEYSLSRSIQPWLLIIPGVQRRFNTLHQARDYATQHIKNVYLKQDCEN